MARLAGVSQKTVSRVMNGERYVSVDVRDRVLAAARELGYRRNTAARALNLGKFHRIGVVTLGSALYGPAQTLVALERAVRGVGYSLSLVTILEGQAGITQAMEALLDQGVDGIILSDPVDEGEGVRLELDVPVVSLGPMPGLAGPNVLVLDDEGVVAGRVATEHLLGLGHATVWHVAGPSRWFSARDRVRGWRQALAAAGVPEPPVIEGDWSPTSGYAAGRQLARVADLTAVFVANDEMAVGVMRAFAEAGRRVPDDVSVVGIDDIPISAYLSPPLTTVRQEFDVMAAHGLELLVERIEDTSPPTPHDEPPVHLVVRESTAPPH
ncbi:LacI family transcriptional regulator [Phytohabitans rumicis]|uniref:LacI family transcriptional regulator n=1 Tax=Phytohabitans rumicis TaxID=1076125 RepID=A0A6V8LJV5_9ACTN|nr:LacI family transcriptional regulator [Phytohabitans rumicis]